MWNMTRAHRLTFRSPLTSVKVWVHFLTLPARAASSPRRLLHPPEGPSALFTACTLHSGFWFAIWVMSLVHLRARICYIVSHSIHAAVDGDTTELQPQQMMMWQPSVQIDKKTRCAVDAAFLLTKQSLRRAFPRWTDTVVFTTNKHQSLGIIHCTLHCKHSGRRNRV